MPKPINNQQQLTVKNAEGEKAPVKNDAVGTVKKSDAVGTVKKNMAGQGKAAEELSVDLLRERRYLWTARAFAIVSAVALCVNFVLLLAIVHLMPLKRSNRSC